MAGGWIDWLADGLDWRVGGWIGWQVEVLAGGCMYWQAVGWIGGRAGGLAGGWMDCRGGEVDWGKGG